MVLLVFSLLACDFARRGMIDDVQEDAEKLAHFVAEYYTENDRRFYLSVISDAR